MIDLLSGQVPLACVDLTSAAEHIKAGTLVAVGVTASKRYSLASDIPTFSEQGVADFDIPAWIGLFGPPGMETATVKQISDSVAKGLSEPEIVSRIERLVCAPAYMDGDAFKTFIGVQSERMREFVKLAQVK